MKPVMNNHSLSELMRVHNFCSLQPILHNHSHLCPVNDDVFITRSIIRCLLQMAGCFSSNLVNKRNIDNAHSPSSLIVNILPSVLQPVGRRTRQKCMKCYETVICIVSGLMRCVSVSVDGLT